MSFTASFTDARLKFTQITNLVMNEGVDVTVFKRNKPAFKIVPIRKDNDASRSDYLAEAADFIDEYEDVLTKLARP